MMRFAYTRQVYELTQWADEMATLGRDRQKAFFGFALTNDPRILYYELQASQLLTI
jgi:hypothetical protein